MELDQAIEKIFKLRGVMDHVYFKDFFHQSELMEKGMGITHIMTLVVLKIEGPSRMCRISDAIDLEKGSFTPVAKRLVNLGFIEKSKDEVDRRATILSLTAKGRDYAEQLRLEHLSHIREGLSIFNREEKEAFFGAVDTLLSMTYELEAHSNNK